MKPILILSILVAFLQISKAQVSTNFRNSQVISARGKFNKGFSERNPHIIPAVSIDSLLEKESRDSKPDEAKPFKIAEAVPVDIDVMNEAVWVEEQGYAYAKFSLLAAGAKTISANFNDFHLPKETELYIYSANGEMITGPVTENENNENRSWGTWVYKGGWLTIELRTLVQNKGEIKLHMSNVAYGYKDIYVADFGNSANCNINVSCPEGNGWENERNSVALILNSSGTAFCSGALINNTCNLNIPYLLTANHCFEADQSVANWRFTFQAWSQNCAPSQNANGITFNGSNLRARNANSDFCLLQLTQTPLGNSNVTYSGWSRLNVASPSGASIGHPRGDVMKIALYNTVISQAVFLNSNDWQVDWSDGTVEPGSSGGPLFNNDHRIIGQVHGGNPIDICTLNDHAFFGRFDLSWTGDGTNETRLSNWLDPGGTGAATTNTRGFSFVSGPDLLCTTGTFVLNNAPGPVTWTVSPSNIVSPSSGSGPVANVTRISIGDATIAFNFGGTCASVGYTFHAGPYSSSDYDINGPSTASCNSNVYFSIPNLVGATSINWTWPSEWTYVSGQGTTNLALYTGVYSGVVGVGVNNTCGPSGSYDTKYVYVSGFCGYSALSIYPNPASTELNISFVDGDSVASKNENLASALGSPYEVKIYNQYQQQVYATEGRSKTLNISTEDLPNGLYIVLVFNKEAIIQRQVLINKK